MVYGEKPMIRHFLKDNPVYEKATNNDPAAVKTVCDSARAMLAKKKIDLQYQRRVISRTKSYER